MTTADIRRSDVEGGGGGHGSSPGVWRSGWVAFAAVMMIFGGAMAIFEGIAAIAKDDVFTTHRNYTYKFDLTSWGWIHLALGILVVLAGAALFRGSMWARVVAVVLAGLSMIANFMWVPYYPFWAFVLIAVDAFVIWALCTAGGRGARV